MKANLHPVIAEYVGTDAALRRILAQSPGGAVVEATILLHDFINGTQSANGAFLAARRADTTGEDTDLCILFLGSWADASLAQSSEAEDMTSTAWPLLHRAKALISNRTPPEVRSYVETVEGRMMGAKGNLTSREEIMKTALARIPRQSPRRKYVILELASLLAELGRLDELADEIGALSPLYSDNFRESEITALRFIDHVETGRILRAQRLAPVIAAADTALTTTRTFKKYRTVLELMSGEVESDGSGSPDRAGVDLPDWALAIQCLISGSVHQALRWARICEKKRPSSTVNGDCISFNLIRAELAEGNGEAARRLLALRHDCGNRHFLDDLFLSRIELLSGERDAAADHFAAAMAAAEAHDAAGRLDFELRLAAEIPRDLLLRLARTCSEKTPLPRLKAAKRPPEPAHTPTTGQEPVGADRFIGCSTASNSIRETIKKLAGLDVPVLITGETGTGKEVVARAIHEAGPGKDLPFVAINCGAISESLLESELFGHEKGAFSGAATVHRGLFEEAGKGIVFLDEIGEISPRLQVALLRVLETGEIRPVGSSKSLAVSCRVLASTNADLQLMTDQRKFRSDLLFRLRRLELHLPPLRERSEDILLLAHHFLDLGRPDGDCAMMSEELIGWLLGYAWPGNVRELRNSIERMRLMNSDKLYYDAADADIGGSNGETAPDAPLQPRGAGEADSTPESLQSLALARKTAANSSGIAIRKKGNIRVRRLELLRALFAEHNLLTRSEIAKALDISPNTATQDLKILCGDGFIDRIQPSASPRSVYFVLAGDQSPTTQRPFR